VRRAVRAASRSSGERELETYNDWNAADVDDRSVRRITTLTIHSVVAARTARVPTGQSALRRRSGPVPDRTATYHRGRLAECRNHSRNVGHDYRLAVRDRRDRHDRQRDRVQHGSRQRHDPIFQLRCPPSGSVDITVTNPGGHAATLARGYTFTAPDSFDANGDWIAHVDGSNHFLTDMRFTIRNNALITLSCGSEASPVTSPITLTVQSGSFSSSAGDGLSMSGKLDSMTTSEGRVNAPGCGDGIWWADKSPILR
jgi:hypothetical protein